MITRMGNWPKIIGVLTIALGIGLSLKASEWVFRMMEALETLHAYVSLVAICGSVASVGIGVAAYRAREWARRTLIGVTSVAIAVCVVYAYFGVTRSITGLGQFDPQVFLWIRLTFVGEALRLLSLPVFFLLVLLHPDVVRSFRPGATPPPSHAMERRAGSHGKEDLGILKGETAATRSRASRRSFYSR